MSPVYSCCLSLSRYSRYFGSTLSFLMNLAITVLHFTVLLCTALYYPVSMSQECPVSPIVPSLSTPWSKTLQELALITSSLLTLQCTVQWVVISTVSGVLCAVCSVQCSVRLPWWPYVSPHPPDPCKHTPPYPLLISLLPPFFLLPFPSSLLKLISG